ncbi:MAG: hypothetical protein N2509_05345, partial [Treponemataceae bacterium]|nr:hypothetical protein [Treponemataceae bacterium]
MKKNRDFGDFLLYLFSFLLLGCGETMNFLNTDPVYKVTVQFDTLPTTEGALIREGTPVTPSVVSLNLSEASMQRVKIQISDKRNNVIGDPITYLVDTGAVAQKKQRSGSSSESLSFSPFFLPPNLLPGPYRILCIVES